jgi:hypothetical protein
MSDLMSGIGQVLRAARRGAGIELQQAAWATRLREDYLEALERDEVDSLDLDPAYVRGTVRTYAGYLGLDGETLVAAHRAGGGANGAVAGTGRRSLPRRLAGLVGIAAVAVIGFVLGAASAQGNLPWSWNRSVVAAPVETPRPAVVREEAQAGARDAVDGESEAVLSAPARSPVRSAPAPRPVRLRMEFSDQVWVRGVTDGDEVFEGIYEPGQVERIRADEEVTLRLGVGGVIEFTLNGVSYGALAAGRSGPIDVRCDASDGCRVVE